ncbi:MAG TPA: type I DNA topoisomerase [Candidatus Limnocylindria bacterium]|jgi:DNA topoisomerase-1|nr:type I DNA topoisomerase [Candidatus Limnocylindria bacterium]
MSGPRNTGGDLVIVESPAKAKTIERYLGDGFHVLASYGHVRDLPKRGLGVDLEHDFAPRYEPLPDRKDELKRLTDAAKTANMVWLATDLDREGESIAWHIAEHAGLAENRIRRVTFSEITKPAIEAAFASPRDLNLDLVDAQQARRIIDRLVGYKLSPLVASKIRRGLTAGRVQSVAVRLVVDREREIQAFTAVEYWTIAADLRRGESGAVFRVGLTKIDGQKAEVGSEEEATAHVAALREASYRVTDVTRGERRQNAPPPFTTSTLQQEASRKLGFSARRTMAAAQALYEGISLPGGQVGLITYMRTDSVSIAASALTEAREVIAARYGVASVPERPNTFRTRSRGAQEAHEAVRPSSFARTPESVEGALKPDHARLYDLIWRRAMASQMAPAVFDQVGVDVEAGRYLLHAGARKRVFDGYQAVYIEGRDEEEEAGAPKLPDLAVGEELDLVELVSDQHFTEPPPRFSEATLIRALEEHGIGRPSTYAPTMEVIRARGYVEMTDRRLHPTEEAFLLTDMLTGHFADVVDPEFTARMETQLDEVAGGRREWVPMVREFWEPFSEQVARGKEEIPKNVEETDIMCPVSGHPMLKRLGRNGWFLGCSGYPECKHTMPLPGEEDPALDLPGVGETCPECGEGTLTGKRSRFGPFLGCSRYPDCKYIHRPEPDPAAAGADGAAGPALEGVGETCPECNQGILAAKRSRFGPFVGCSRYPDCKYIRKSRSGSPRAGSGRRKGAKRGSRRRASPRA